MSEKKKTDVRGSDAVPCYCLRWIDRYFIHLREKPTNTVKGLTLRFSSVTPVEQTHSPHEFTASSYNWRFVGPTTSLERYENKAVSVGGIFITGEYVFLAHASDNWSQLKKYRGWGGRGSHFWTVFWHDWDSDWQETHWSYPILPDVSPNSHVFEWMNKNKGKTAF